MSVVHLKFNANWRQMLKEFMLIEFWTESIGDESVTRDHPWWGSETEWFMWCDTFVCQLYEMKVPLGLAASQCYSWNNCNCHKIVRKSLAFTLCSNFRIYSCHRLAKLSFNQFFFWFVWIEDLWVAQIAGALNTLLRSISTGYSCWRTKKTPTKQTHTNPHALASIYKKRERKQKRNKFTRHLPFCGRRRLL